MRYAYAYPCAILALAVGLAWGQTTPPKDTTPPSVPVVAAEPPAVTWGCKLQWDMPRTPDLAGFRFYNADKSKGYVKGKYVGKPMAVDTPPDALTTYAAFCADFGAIKHGATYYLAVTAYDKLGNESAFSQEVSLKVDIAAEEPTGMRVEVWVERQPPKAAAPVLRPGPAPGTP